MAVVTVPIHKEHQPEWHLDFASTVYYLEANTTVNPGSTLTLEPGVTIAGIWPRYSLQLCMITFCPCR